MIGTDSCVFFIMALVTLSCSLAVLLLSNPIYCVLALVGTMIGVAGLFVTLNAYFLAAVQIIVYAGAVMVLFLMVVMLFDLKRETVAFAAGLFSGGLKIGFIALFTGFVIGAVFVTAPLWLDNAGKVTMSGAITTLATLLFTRYVFLFQVMGVMLLLVVVGVVVLVRQKGGIRGR